MKYNIILISLNPSLDVTLWVQNLDFNEPIKPIKEKTYPGGKSINVAKMLEKLCIPNKLIGISGTYNFHSFSNLLNLYNVNYDFIKFDGSIRENLTVIVNNNDSILKINRNGCPVPDSILCSLSNLIKSYISLDSQNLLIFSGSIPPNVKSCEYKDFIMSLKDDNNKIVLDNDIFSFNDILKIRPYIIKPNYVELLKIYNAKNFNKSQIKYCAKELSNYVDHVLISLGGDGLCYCSKSDCINLSVPHVQIKSTVGAGDTTLSGFIYGLYNDLNIYEALKFAVACGTASVTVDGTDVISKDMIYKYIDMINFVDD